jgi:hypothetical protein
MKKYFKLLAAFLILSFVIVNSTITRADVLKDSQNGGGKSTHIILHLRGEGLGSITDVYVVFNDGNSIKLSKLNLETYRTFDSGKYVSSDIVGFKIMAGDVQLNYSIDRKTEASGTVNYFAYILTPTPVTGKITIYKDVDNIDNDTNTFNVLVTGPNYSKTVSIKEGVPAEVSGLSAGSYTLTEADNSEYTIKSTNPVEIKLGEGDNPWNKETTFINNKNEVQVPTGTIKIYKNVDNVVNNTDTFYVSITGPNNYSNTVPIKVSVPGEVNGLPAGIYTLREIGDTNYTIKSANPVEIKMGEGENPWNKVATFVNEKNGIPTPTTGKITIYKDVDNIRNDANEFEVLVTGPNYSQTVKIKEGKPAEISGLAEGEYTLTESTNDDYTIRSTNPVKIKLGEGVNPWSKVVTFINHYKTVPKPTEEPTPTPTPVVVPEEPVPAGPVVTPAPTEVAVVTDEPVPAGPAELPTLVNCHLNCFM